MQTNISSQEDIKQLILDIEEKWPVDKWNINGIDVWPYIRIKIYTYYLSKLFSTSVVDNNNNRPVEKNVLFMRLRHFFQLISSYFILEYFFLKLKRKKLIFFGAHYHRIVYDGKYFNRFYDSMIKTHNLENDVYTIEYRKINKENFNSQAIINLEKHLGFYKSIKKLTSKFDNKKNEYTLEGFEEFYAFLDLKNIGVEKVNLVKWSQKINSTKGFFNIIYKKIKPEKIVFLGYYGLDDLTAALVSAKECNINSVDLQHGSQINNMAFSDWTKIPANGYNTVVNEFWTWDEESKKNIDLWAAKTTNTKAKVIGQPYVSYWLNKKEDTEKSKKKILYTLHLSNLEDMLTPEVISLIKKVDYEWVLRLHPRNSLSKENIENFLVANEIDEKVTIQNPVEKPLPEMLTESILHITNYSGSLIEARMMNIPTVIINKLGLEIYNQYLDENLVFFIDFEKTDFASNCQRLIMNIENKEKISPKLQVFNPLS